MICHGILPYRIFFNSTSGSDEKLECSNPQNVSVFCHPLLLCIIILSSHRENRASASPKIAKFRDCIYGERRELPSGVRGQLEPRPKTDFCVFWRPQNAPFCAYMTKIWGGQFVLASPTPNSGGLVPRDLRPWIRHPRPRKSQWLLTIMMPCIYYLTEA